MLKNKAPEQKITSKDNYFQKTSYLCTTSSNNDIMAKATIQSVRQTEKAGLKGTICIEETTIEGIDEKTFEI